MESVLSRHLETTFDSCLRSLFKPCVGRLPIRTDSRRKRLCLVSGHNALRLLPWHVPRVCLLQDR